MTWLTCTGCGWPVDGTRRCDYQSVPGAPPCNVPLCRNCGIANPIREGFVDHPGRRDYCPEHAKAAK